MLWETQVDNKRGTQAQGSENATRRPNYIDDGDPSNGSSDEATGNTDLKIGGTGETPFVKKGNKQEKKLRQFLILVHRLPLSQTKIWRKLSVLTFFLHDLYRNTKNVII